MKNAMCLVAAMALVVVATSGPALAAFNAADLVYVPVVAHTTGLNDSVWRSDVSITNVGDTDAIDVALEEIRTAKMSFLVSKSCEAKLPYSFKVAREINKVKPCSNGCCSTALFRILDAPE